MTSSSKEALPFILLTNIKCTFTASNWLHNSERKRSQSWNFNFLVFTFGSTSSSSEAPGALIPEFSETRSRKWLKTSIARRAIILRMLLSSEIMPPVAGVGTKQPSRIVWYSILVYWFTSCGNVDSNGWMCHFTFLTTINGFFFFQKVVFDVDHLLLEAICNDWFDL